MLSFKPLRFTRLTVAIASFHALTLFAAPETFRYLVGPRDVLSIVLITSTSSVSEDGTSTFRLKVNASGDVALPLVGKFRVAGKTVSDIETSLTKRYRTFYQSPQVSVAVDEYRAKVVYVLGQVKQNGPIYLEHEKTTLSEVISEAGGFVNPMVALTEGADSRNIIVTRGKDRIVVNLHQRLTNLDKVEYFYVEAGDHIFVPKPLKRFQVLGGVKRAGEYELVEGMTMLRALSLAGSFNDKARRERVYVLRRQGDGTKKRLHVDCRKICDGREKDLLIQPDDVIFVAEW